MALLLWAYLTSIALFLGIAFCAQLEAVRAGVRDPDRGDPEDGRADAGARECSLTARRRQTLPLRIRPSQAAASR